MLSVATRDELAAELAEAARRRTPLTPLTIVYPDIDVVDAYEIQLINIRQRVAEGARVVGPQGRAVLRGDAEDDGRRGARLRALALRDGVFRGPAGGRGRYLFPASRSRWPSFWPTICPARAAPRMTSWPRPPRSRLRSRSSTPASRTGRSACATPSPITRPPAASCWAASGFAQGHRRQRDRGGVVPGRRSGRRGSQRRRSRQPRHRGGVVGPQGRQLRRATQGRRHHLARVVHPGDRRTPGESFVADFTGLGSVRVSFD